MKKDGKTQTEKWLCGCLLVVVSATAALALDAQTALLRSADGETVVTVADMDAVARRKAPDVAVRSAILSKRENVQMLAQELYVNRVLAQRAVQEGLQVEGSGKKPENVAADAPQQEEALTKAWWQAFVNRQQPDEAALEAWARTRYAAMTPEELHKPPFVHLWQIFIPQEQEAEAKALAQQLALTNTPPAELASVLPASARVKEVGWVAEAELPPVVQEALQKLPGDSAAYTTLLNDDAGAGHFILYRVARSPEGKWTFEETRSTLMAESLNRIVQGARAAETEKILQSVVLDEEAIAHYAESRGQVQSLP